MANISGVTSENSSIGPSAVIQKPITDLTPLEAAARFVKLQARATEILYSLTSDPVAHLELMRAWDEQLRLATAFMPKWAEELCRLHSEKEFTMARG